jgi:hypothetical protein
MLFRMKYTMPDGKLYMDRAIRADNEHDAHRVASFKFEEAINTDRRNGCNMDYILYVTKAKLTITEGNVSK